MVCGWTRTKRRALLLTVTPFRPVFPALVLLTAATAAAQISPFVTANGRQVTVYWSSGAPGTTELAWGATPAPSFVGYPNRFTAPGTSTAHSATLRRLSPGTWYLRARSGMIESPERTVIVPVDGAPLADWAFDGTVNALLQQGSRWYVGGDFQSVGQTTGGGAPTLFDGGLLPQFPEVAGQVLAVESDGMGGFYLGGSFTSVGGLPRSNVAHLFADLGVDPQWNPVCNGPVYAIQPASNGNVFLGGGFTEVSTLTRGPLVEISTAGVPTLWNPNVNGLVFAIEQVGSNLYIGGTFSVVNGQGRRGLAAVDTTTGVLQPWNPSLTGGFVTGLMALGSVMYVHGAFSGIGSQSRAGLASLDSAGNVLPWNPPLPSGQVSAFAPNGASSLFIGGSFTSVGALNRPALALVDTDAGQPLPWNAGITSGQIIGLTTEGGGISAVGSFARTVPGLSVATFSTSNGTALAVGPRFNGIARVVARSPSVVFVGGDFTGLREQARTGLAAISSSTGALEPFSPTLSGGSFGTGVNALASQGSNLVVGGNFAQVDGTGRNNAAMFSATGALSLTWNPNVNGEVHALAVTPAGVLLGGLFSQVNGGALRGNGAVVDVVNGQATTFNPGFNSAVFGIAAEGTASYWVGGFGTTTGIARDHAAEFTVPDGTLGAWNPAVTTEVKAVHVVGDTVVLGGAFNFVNSFVDRGSLAVFDRDAGRVTPFDVRLAGVGVRALTSADTTLYAGGENLTDAGLLMAVDLTTSVVQRFQVRGQTDLFFATKMGSIQSLATDCAGQRIAVGGFFHSSGLTPVGGVTLIAAPCTLPGVDAGALDAGAADAGSADAGSADAGSADAGSADAGSADAGLVDAGLVEPDAGMGTIDAGTIDAGILSDAGSAVDAGVTRDGGAPVDAGSLDGGGAVLDAGDGADAGPDGGMGLVFVPTCGCSGVDQAPLGLGLLLALLVRRRPRRRAP